VAKKVFIRTVKLPAPHEPVSVDIYADSINGYWSASVGENSHESASLSDVQTWIDKMVKTGLPDPVEYAPFIEIHRPWESDRHTWRGPTRSSLIFDFGVKYLSKEVYEETVRGSKNEPAVRRFRLVKKAVLDDDLTIRVDVDHEPKYDTDRRRVEDSTGDSSDQLTSSIVPYTSQRWQALLAITNQLNSLRERLGDILVQKGGASAADILDKVTVRQLLAPPEGK